jgi:transcription antitermination factor NusG
MCEEKNNIDKIPNLIWTPVRTKPRQEKKLASYCDSHSVPFYLPLQKRVKRYQRRTVESELPMFPGYIFCAVNEDLYRTLLVSGTIVYRIAMDDLTEQRLIFDLNALKEFERLVQLKDVVIRPEIVQGVQVCVRSGPLAGVSGIVENRDKGTFITVNVDILGQAVSSLIDIEDLELED